MTLQAWNLWYHCGKPKKIIGKDTYMNQDLQIIYPPRPRGKMHPKDLGYYEKTGKWLAQRKFRGSRCMLHVSKNRQVTIANRHGSFFANFRLDKEMESEIIAGLSLDPNMEYWFDGELMNKDVQATNEIILFDVLQIGRYLINSPTQTERLNLLFDICNKPQKKCISGIALEVTKKLWLAEVFTNDFENRFKEAIECRQLEGLVLRKKLSSLDNFGSKEYETDNLIRCRKPFSCETLVEGRSGGYQF
jgi:ATP-dependent DNA ligase